MKCVPLLLLNLLPCWARGSDAVADWRRMREQCLSMFTSEYCQLQYPPLQSVETPEPDGPREPYDCREVCHRVVKEQSRDLSSALQHFAALMPVDALGGMGDVTTELRLGDQAQRAWNKMRVALPPLAPIIRGIADNSTLLRMQGGSMILTEWLVDGEMPSQEEIEELALSFERRRTSPPVSGLGIIEQNFIGQPQVLSVVEQFIEDSLSFVGYMKKGPQVFLFVGPPGTGKTYLSGLVAQVLGRNKVHLAMANYKKKADVDSLIGSRQGLEGDGHLLGNLMRFPDSVVVMDEIEKAHPSLITEFLLSIFSEGIIQGKKTGEDIDISESTWILTSNCFQDVVTNQWNAHTGSYDEKFLSSLMKDISQTYFRDADYVCRGPPSRPNPFASPAFIDRVQDQVLVFTPNLLDDHSAIAALELERIYGRLRKKQSKQRVTLIWPPETPRTFAMLTLGRSVRTLEALIQGTLQTLTRPLVKILGPKEEATGVILPPKKGETRFRLFLRRANHQESSGFEDAIYGDIPNIEALDRKCSTADSRDAGRCTEAAPLPTASENEEEEQDEVDTAKESLEEKEEVAPAEAETEAEAHREVEFALRLEAELLQVKEESRVELLQAQQESRAELQAAEQQANKEKAALLAQWETDQAQLAEKQAVLDAEQRQELERQAEQIDELHVKVEKLLEENARLKQLLAVAVLVAAVLALGLAAALVMLLKVGLAIMFKFLLVGLVVLLVVAYLFWPYLAPIVWFLRQLLGDKPLGLMIAAIAAIVLVWVTMTCSRLPSSSARIVVQRGRRTCCTARKSPAPFVSIVHPIDKSRRRLKADHEADGVPVFVVEDGNLPLTLCIAHEAAQATTPEQLQTDHQEEDEYVQVEAGTEAEKNSDEAANRETQGPKEGRSHGKATPPEEATATATDAGASATKGESTASSVPAVAQ